MSYLTKDMTQRVLSRLVDFERGLKRYFESHGLDLHEDIGRRNALVSSAQETFFALALGEIYRGVERDGKPGQPDIMIGEMNLELECKMTSGSGGSWSLQTDYTTLTRKGMIDFLYVLATPEFDRFCVLHFQGLTPDDFHPPSPGSREKSRMNKALAMEKCEVLWGDANCRNDKFLTGLRYERDKLTQEMQEVLTRLDASVNAAVKGNVTSQQSEKLLSLRDRETDRYSKKLTKLNDRIEHWKETEQQWAFTLNPLG